MKRDRMPWKTIPAAILFVLSLWPAALWAEPGEVLAAVASSMKFVFEKLAAEFQRDHPGIRVKFSFGSSGNFFGQIKHGAPYDLFFSADMDYPTRLAKEGQGRGKNQVVPYAVGHIVLWIPQGTGLDVKRDRENILLNKKVLKVSIANPAHAPYGRAAVEWLTEAQIYSQVKPRLVYGENIAQAAQFVHSQAAQAGIIALSLALDPKMAAVGAFWKIPEEQYSPIEQGFLILKNAGNPKAAESFADFVTGPVGGRILKKYGFTLPRGKNP
ncbi:MAG: molybdate ABC transporter substrate-binding protein [Nitrospinae bacterium]|nr:molybdate ABC transporter substrate-binding protein [Nitrospinota bacterium]